jgi:anti-sigma factor RsiW
MNTSYLYRNLYFPSARLSGTPLFAPVNRFAGTNLSASARLLRRPAPAPAPARPTIDWTNNTPRRPRRFMGALAAAILALLATGSALASLSGGESADGATRHAAE